MANHTYSKGLLYKKTLNSSGEVTGSVPLLLKTLGSLVIMSDGTDAETAISTAISNMVTPDETTIVTGQDGITISVKKSTSAEIDEILGDVPTSHTWEGYYTKSETEALIDAVDDKITQSGIETALGYTPIPTTAKGSNNGVAELDSAGKVPASQLPSYVDDVIESATYAALPATGEAGKIYVTLNDDKTYRWSGSAYVEISASLALGETSSTAYRGDRGKTAYDHSQAAHARTDATNAAIVSGKLNINGTATNIGDFKAVSTAASQGLTDTEKTNARTNIDAASNSDLVEVVDNGAKNLLNTIELSTIKSLNTSGTWNGNAYTFHAITFLFNADGSISVSGTPEGTTTLYLAPLSSIGMVANVEYIGYGLDGGTSNYYIGLLGITGVSNLRFYDANRSITTADLTNFTDVIVRIDGSAAINTTFHPMICTKAQFGISSAYVPYALPNYDLTRRVSDLQKKAVKVYTYHVNPNESDPEDAVTYLDDATGLTPAKMGASSFSYGSWANAWFLPRPCVLKFDGTVDYYLDPNDYSKKTDGTASTIDSSNSTGNVMLEFPKIWVKRVNDGNGARTVSIAPVNVDGTYKCWSNINAEDKEVDHFYLPAYNGTIHNTKMRSLSGVTLNSTYAPNKTRAEEVTLATANNPTGKNMWYTETWADMCLVYDLLYLMGKSLDVQRTFGQGLSSGSETAMRAYVTGTHNAKGLFYGDISGQATGVKVLGMENLWGCRWHGVAGLINDNGTLKVKMTYGVADGSTTVGYNTTGSGYLNYGSTHGTNGFVKKMQADNTMGYKIIETAGSDATYYCDYYYTNNSQLNYALVGGHAGDGSYCGFYVNVCHAPAYALWDVGAALSCRP